jgi:Rhodanese-like domain
LTIPLREIYEGKGIQPENEVITYCRIGERSTHTWFALTQLLGYPNVRNYDGSWTEWGNLVRSRYCQLDNMTLSVFLARRIELLSTIVRENQLLAWHRWFSSRWFMIPSIGMLHHHSFGKPLALSSILPLLWTKFDAMPSVV